MAVALEVQCGEHIKGVKYTTTDSDAEKEQKAKSPEECCDHCKKTEKGHDRDSRNATNGWISGCVVWTFLDGTCHMFLNEVGTREPNENATSGFIVTGNSIVSASPGDVRFHSAAEVRRESVAE